VCYRLPVTSSATSRLPRHAFDAYLAGTIAHDCTEPQLSQFCVSRVARCRCTTPIHQALYLSTASTGVVGVPRSRRREGPYLNL
jgi:hypothetical protein